MNLDRLAFPALLAMAGIIGVAEMDNSYQRAQRVGVSDGTVILANGGYTGIVSAEQLAKPQPLWKLVGQNRPNCQRLVLREPNTREIYQANITDVATPAPDTFYVCEWETQRDPVLEMTLRNYG